MTVAFADELLVQESWGKDMEKSREKIFENEHLFPTSDDHDNMRTPSSRVRSVNS